MATQIKNFHPQENSFQVTFPIREGDSQTGPLDLLWNLIKSYQVSIFEVSLTAIIKDFIIYMNNNTIPLEEQSSFSNTLARLIYYKSEKILPSYDDAEDNDDSLDTLPKELVENLLEYKRMQVMAGHLKDMYVDTQKSLSKEPGWDAHEIGANFLQVDFLAFLKAYQDYLNRAKKKSSQDNFNLADMEEEINLEELWTELYEALLEKKMISFFELIKNCSLLKCIGFFLAALELSKLRQVRITQDELSYDISIQLKES